MEKEGDDKMKTNLVLDLEPERMSYADLLKIDDDKIKVNVLDDCYIDLKAFCEENNIIVKRYEEE